MARGFNYKLTKAFGATEHTMTVISVRDVTPSFRRIRFHAPTIIDGRETPIASVGPVVSDELTSHGLRTDIYPANEAYFMKPLISAMATALGKRAPRAASE